jgi:uncharacterized protein
MADATKHPAPDGASRGRCPICKAPTEVAYRPFCSKRCADVDLARWLGGAYAIAGGGADADEDGDDGAARPGDTDSGREP